MKKNFEIEDKKPVANEIADRLYEYIVQNEFWGKRLPSQRDLVKLLDTGLVSVNKAIKILQERGLVISYPKRGSFVISKNEIPDKNAVKRKKMVVVSYWGGKKSASVRFVDDMGKFSPLLNACEDKNVDIIFAKLNEPGDEKDILKDYPPEATDYVVFNAIYENEELVKYISTHYRYSLLIDHYFDRAGITGILDNGIDGMEKLANHLIDLGHKRFVLFDHQDETINPWKRQGYINALAESGLDYSSDTVFYCSSGYRSIFPIVETLMKREEPPTAIMCVDDNRALRVIEALEQLKFKIGEDVSVTGYGDVAHKRREYMDLTSVYFDESQFGELAVDYFFNNKPDKPGQMIALNTELVVRKTTGEPKG